jgi:hypothetical protein
VQASAAATASTLPTPPTASARPTSAPSASASASALAGVEGLTPHGFAPGIKPSAPPKVAEWNDAAELEVKNAKRLGCEVKFVREWVRVSCRTTEQTSSQIVALNWIEPSAKPADFYDLVKAGQLASIVFPVRRNSTAKVEFVWTTFTRPLTVSWSAGTPVPIVYFSGDAPADLSKPNCVFVCGIPYYPGRGTDPCPPTHDPTNGEDNGCICRAYRDKTCTEDW